MRLEVPVLNESEQTWPADVPPVAACARPLLVATPVVAGDYRCTIEPVQSGGASLERCGARPLDLPVRID